MRLALSIVRLVVCGASLGAIACGGGGGDADGGTEFTCPDGVNPDGNGCLLPCADGWHGGPDGACLADCPTIAEENEAGECEARSCPDGWYPTSAEWGDANETVYFCARDCPTGTSMTGADCIMDCGEGWSMGSDDRCHLDCPDGMTAGPGVADCAPDGAGENKTCPSGTFDLGIDGPNPVFVDVAGGSDSNDGSEGSPLATIGHAIATMGDSATIYLAAGVYPEWVLAEGKAELNLVGLCAAEVRIEPPGPAPESHGDVAGAIQTFDTDTVRIHGVTVASPGYGIRIEHTGGLVAPVAATVDQVRVESAAEQGVRVSGSFDAIDLANASVTQAAGGISSNNPAVVLVSDVHVRDSHVHDLLPGAETEANYSSGIEVEGAISAEVTGNLVEHLVRQVGISVETVGETTLIEGNSVRDLQGGAGIASRVNAHSPTISDNVIADVAVAPGGWDPLGTDTPVGIRLSVALDREGWVESTQIARVQGVGLLVFGSTNGPGTVAIAGNEIIDSVTGVIGQFASLSMTDNRMDRVGSFLNVLPDDTETALASELVIRGNSFSNRAAIPPTPPESSYAQLANDSYCIYALASALLFEGNTLHGNAALPEDKIDLPTQLGFFGDSLIARDNSITEFEGDAIGASVSTAEVSGNRVLFGDVGLNLVPSTHVLGDALIDGNLFYSLYEGVYFSWNEGHGAVQLTENTFGFAPFLWGPSSSGSTPGAGLLARGNHFLLSAVAARAVLELSLEDNLLTHSDLLSANQPEGSALTVAGNRFQRAGVVLLQSEGDASVTGNGFAGGDIYYGVGIATIDSAGPLTVRHNVFSDTAAVEVASVGEVADGIQVVGGAAASPVDVRENLFCGNGRAGVLLHGATGIVEGNMYLDNGAGEEADFVLQASGEGAVTGWDTGFATVPVEPYGVLQKENLGWE